ncbi:M16 family metallopeptidase [Neisseria zalophi]
MLMLRRMILLFLLSTSPAWAQTLSKTLPNGLKVIVKEDNRAPVAVSQIWYRVGSIDEKEGKTGLSHALEHMMFKGTPSVPSGEFSRRVSALGGRNNAYTTRNETVFFENIAAGNLPEVLAMEADRMKNLNFSDKDFDNEMNVIREERRLRTEDSPYGKLWEHIFLNSYQTPALRAPVIGYMNDLNILKANDLRQWYQKWYAPNNATLVIVGDVDAKQTLNTVTKLFAPIPSKTLPARNRFNNEKMATKPVRAQTFSAVTRQPVFALSYRVPKLRNIGDKMPYALDVLSDILSGNSSSRLDKNLVRGKQVALNVGTNYDLFNREMPLFTIVGMPGAGTDVDTLVRLMRNEIDDIAQNGITQEELDRIRKLSAASEIYANDSITAQASLMGKLETRGFKYSDEAELRRRLQQVTIAEVQAAAKLLTPERSSLVVVQPQSAQVR